MVDVDVKLQTFGVVHGPRGHDEPMQTCSSFHLQQAQNLEEQTAEAIMVLKGNNNVLLSLRDFYQDLRKNDLFPLKDTCASDLSAFVTQIDGFISDANMQIERGTLLANNIAARRTMVRFDVNFLPCQNVRLPFVDPSTSTEPGDGKNGKINDQHAERFPHGQDHSVPDVFVPPSYLCFGKPRLLLNQMFSTDYGLDVLQHGHHKIPGSRLRRREHGS